MNSASCLSGHEYVESHRLRGAFCARCGDILIFPSDPLKASGQGAAGGDGGTGGAAVTHGGDLSMPPAAKQEVRIHRIWAEITDALSRLPDKAPSGLEQIAAVLFIIGGGACLPGVMIIAVGRQGVKEPGDYVGLALVAVGAVMMLGSYAVLTRRHPEAS